MNDLNWSTRMTLLIIVSAACMGSAIVAPLYPLLGKYFNLTQNQIPSLVSIYLSGYLIGQILYSFLSMKYGYKLSLKIGFIIYILSSLLQIIAIKLYLYNLFFYCRLFSALGASSGLICTFAIINKFSDKENIHKLISMAFMSLTLSAYLFITVGGVVNDLYGFNAVFYILILIAILQLGLILKFIPEFSETHLHYKNNTLLSICNNYLKFLLNPKLLLSSLIVAFTTTSTYLYNATAASISHNILLFSTQTFGYFSILLLTGLLSGSLLSSLLSNKFSSSKVLSAGLYISFISLFMLFIFNNYILKYQANIGYVFFILVALLNLGLGLIYPSASYIALNSIRCSTTASSIMNFIKILLPTLVIFIVSRTDLSLIDSFQIPLLIFFLITCVNTLIIKFMEKSLKA